MLKTKPWQVEAPWADQLQGRPWPRSSLGSPASGQEKVGKVEMQVASVSPSISPWIWPGWCRRGILAEFLDPLTFSCSSSLASAGREVKTQFESIYTILNSPTMGVGLTIVS